MSPFCFLPSLCLSDSTILNIGSILRRVPPFLREASTNGAVVLIHTTNMFRPGTDWLGRVEKQVLCYLNYLSKVKKTVKEGNLCFKKRTLRWKTVSFSHPNRPFGRVILNASLVSVQQLGIFLTWPCCRSTMTFCCVAIRCLLLYVLSLLEPGSGRPQGEPWNSAGTAVPAGGVWAARVHGALS